MGALLLGSANDPAEPAWVNPEGAPRFNTRLTAIKGFHRLCDGVRTVFLVDRQGDLMRAGGHRALGRAGARTGPAGGPVPSRLRQPCQGDAAGGHVCLVLTPSQEIKVFAEGTLAFAFSDARWRLLDIPTKYAAWCKAVSAACPATSRCGSSRRR